MFVKETSVSLSSEFFVGYFQINWQVYFISISIIWTITWTHHITAFFFTAFASEDILLGFRL